MNDSQEKTHVAPRQGAGPDAIFEEDEINLLDLLLVLLKHKKLMFKIVGVAFILSIVVSLLLPKKYTATALILPPVSSQPSVSGLLSQAGGALGGLAGSLLGENTPADLYVGILNSRTVADALIDKFNLKELYDIEYKEDLFKALAEHTNVSISTTDQIISVSVTEKDPKLAADMANTYVEALDKVNRTVNISEGNRKRLFLKDRLDKVSQDLAQAEINLKEFQEKYKLVSIEDQARAALEGAAQIKAEIITAQTELEVLKQFGTEKQNEAVMLRSKIDELQKQLEKMDTGRDIGALIENENPGPNKANLFIPFDEIPKLGLELGRLMREVKIQSTVFELLTTQYELAKIEEAKDVNTLQVLDKASPPDKKSSPKRSLIVILSTFAAGFIAVFTAFFMEFAQKLKTEDPDRYQQIKNNLIFWKNKG